MTTTTRSKGSAFNFADQGVFTSAIDVGCTSALSAAANKALIVTALTTLGAASGGIILIPHNIPHNFTSADFPVTAQALCVWEITGTSFKLTTNQTHTTNLGALLETVRIDMPMVVGVDFVDVLTDPPTYTYSVEVFNDAGTPVVAGSSFDLCTFLPGIATPVEAIARSGATPGLHYFFKGIKSVLAAVFDAAVTVGTTLGVTGAATFGSTVSITGTILGSKSIQAPLTATAIVCADGTESLILNHTATIAALTVTLPATPANGTPFKLFSRSIVTTLTLNAGAGETIETGHGLTTLAAAASAEWVYNLSDTKWYRVA
jgi:hypothetical protein